MTDVVAQLTLKLGEKSIQYRRQDGRYPTIVFIHGFRSDMGGAKAQHLQQICLDKNLGFLSFDLRGHGQNAEHYADFTIGDWVEDTLDVIDHLTTGPVVLVGSSLGGWLMLRAASLRPERVKGLIGIAPAPDFPTRMILPQLTESQKQQLAQNGHITDPRETGFSTPTVFTRRLIEESATHNLFGNPPAFTGPVRFLQGMQDTSVPWQQTTQLADNMKGSDVRVTLFRSGDHRLNETAQLAELGRQVLEVVELISGSGAADAGQSAPVPDPSDLEPGP